MSKDKFHDLYVTRLLAEVQTLEEIGGPATLEGYITILNEVKADIEQRIINAQARIEAGEK